MSESPLPTPSALPETDSALPGVITRLPIAGDSHRILDFRYDRQTGRLFISTTEGRLVVLSDFSYEKMTEFPFGGELNLDTEGRRLYVGPGRQYVPPGEPISVRVLDVDGLDVVDELPGVHAVSVDRQNGRLFAGSPVRSSDDERSATTVRAYDLETLDLLYEIEHQGIPVYNPFRDDLVVIGYTALVVDPDTGEVARDLLPELAEQPFPWCNGCNYASAATIIEPQRQLVIERETFSTGGGPGFSPPDVYLDASTLDKIHIFAEKLPFQPTCSTLWLPVPPYVDHIYWQRHFVRNIVYRNFDVHDLDGTLIAWRDGLLTAFIDTEAGLAYSTQGYVLELDSLTPVARLPEFCLLDDDSSNGKVFGRIDGDLIVVAIPGGFQVTPPPTEPEPLPAAPIEEIYVSPGYPDDPTIFLLMEDSRLYRTTDAGTSWQRIQGGLPAHSDLSLTISLSPDFADDRTLFAGGFVDSYRGEGVLRSTDAGDTWQPMWDGLTHLRVYDVRPSSDYAIDGTVRALARYNRLAPWEEGVSLHESDDRGLSWNLVMTATNSTELENRISASIPITEEVPLRIVDYGNRIEALENEGSWHDVNLEQKEGETVRAIVPSPSSREDDTFYALGDFSLWRTTDGGTTWQRWRDPRLAGRNRDNSLTALAVTPQEKDGSHRLLVGTRAGEFWILTPELADEPAEPPIEPIPTPTSQPADSGGVGEPVDMADDLLHATPPAGLYRPGGALAAVWEASTETRTELGWALTDMASAVPAAIQIFEHGSMIWDGGNASILVLNEDGSWQRYEDTFEEGEPESDPSLMPPGGGFQPIRGFGKLWRAENEVRDALGWALDEEYGYTAFVHEFEGGTLFSTPAGTRVLIRDTEAGGTWR